MAEPGRAFAGFLDILLGVWKSPGHFLQALGTKGREPSGRWSVLDSRMRTLPFALLFLSSSQQIENPASRILVFLARH